MFKLSPSILAANFAVLGEEITLLHRSKAPYIHIDVMDGVFVPASSFGAPVIKAIRSYTDKVFDVHLMVQNPDAYIESMVEAGADSITIHAEACVHLYRSVQLIKQYGKRVGVALNPATPLHVLDYVLQELDMVLIMSVNPGFGGQAYIEQATEKIKSLRKMIDASNLPTELSVDGGINLKNIAAVLRADADVAVAGSAIFAGNPMQKIEEFYAVCRKETI